MPIYRPSSLSILCLKLFSDCQESLGVSNGLIKDSQFTASSSYDEHHQPYHARLNKTVKGSRGGWCSAFADETEFLEVNLGNRRSISGEKNILYVCFCHYCFGLITLTTIVKLIPRHFLLHHFFSVHLRFWQTMQFLKIFWYR